MANRITTPGPYHVQAGRVIADAKGRLVALCYSRRKVGETAPQYEPEGIHPSEADDNAHLLARAWTMRAALQRARLALEDSVKTCHCDLCDAECRSGIGHSHVLAQCWPIALADHAQECAYRVVAEALEGIE